MALQTIPDDIRRFVLNSVPSVPYLEALLLLRAEPDRSWSAEAVAERLYVRARVAQALLDQLCEAGMAVPRRLPDAAPAYFYQPESAQLRQLVDRVAEVYARRLVDMTHLIHSKLDRQAQLFADAFKWRKD